MRPLSKAAFHKQFAASGLALDTRYSPPQTLVFPKYDALSWTWPVPTRTKDWPRWIASLIDAAGAEESFYLYPRQGAWSSGYNLKAFQTSSVFCKVGLHPDGDEVLEASHDERDAIETLFFIALLHGGTVSDDIFLIPDHGKVILYADHHEAVHAGFSDGDFMNQVLSEVKEIE